MTPAHSPSPTSNGPLGTPDPAGFEPRSATFISSRTGWVLGTSACPGGTGRCDVIVRTRDGGRTWRAIPSPATTPDRLAQIRFANEADGFVTGDQLWATHDGGATWRPIPGVKAAYQLAAAAGRVWIDSAQDLLSAPVAGGRFVKEPASVVGSFALRGDRVVYAGDTGPQVFVGRHGGPFVERTSPCADGARPIVGLGEGHWLLVCAGDAGLGHEEKHAYRSTDSGRSWAPVSDPPQLSGTDIFPTSDGDFVIDHQEVAALRDGTWRVVLRTDGGVSEGGFESAVLGYCIGGFAGSAAQTMELTRDAGRTWQRVAF